jgi:hypothetical protein
MSSVSDNGDELGAITVKEFGARYHLGHTKIYEEIGAGRLRAVKCGSRTLILARMPGCGSVRYPRSLLANSFSPSFIF